MLDEDRKHAVCRATGLTLILALLSACSGESGTGSEDSGSQQVRDRPEDIEPLSVGMQREGERGALRVELLDFEPSPPELGYNTWRLALWSMDDNQPYVAEQLGVEPFMPKHNHGSTVVPVVKDGDEPGTYVVDRVNFIMGGHWTVTICACPEGAVSDQQRCDETNSDRLDCAVLETWIHD